MNVVVPFWAFQEVRMALKNVFAAFICTTLLAWSSLSMADEYRAGELLGGLDLSKAVLSPKLLGPTSQFAPVPVGVKADPGNRGEARVVPKAEPRITIRKTHIAHMRVKRSRGALPTKLAHRHGNPLDAQAFDTRIQVWPCKSGGICNWRRPAAE